eukprot:COSAG05_NODE_155_length_15704_cov_84.777315_14_plen_39_part_00
MQLCYVMLDAMAEGPAERSTEESKRSVILDVAAGQTTP